MERTLLSAAFDLFSKPCSTDRIPNGTSIFSWNDAVVEGCANFTCKRYTTLEDAAVRVAPETKSAFILWGCFAITG